jgi:hypothetical protein
VTAFSAVESDFLTVHSGPLHEIKLSSSQYHMPTSRCLPCQLRSCGSVSPQNSHPLQYLHLEAHFTSRHSLYVFSLHRLVVPLIRSSSPLPDRLYLSHHISSRAHQRCHIHHIKLIKDPASSTSKLQPHFLSRTSHKFHVNHYLTRHHQYNERLRRPDLPC